MCGVHMRSYYSVADVLIAIVKYCSEVQVVLYVFEMSSIQGEPACML